MGLFLGLGLLGAAFGIDAMKQAPYDRALRRLEREYGPFNKETFHRCLEMKSAVEHCRRFENEDKPIVSWKELNRTINLYKQNQISFPYDAAVHDIAKMAVMERGFDYIGYTINVVTTGQICDEKNIHKLGIFGTKTKFSERRCLMTGRILAFEQKNNGKLKTSNELFDFLEKEGCKTQELYNAYAQKFQDTFESDDLNNYYYLGLEAALNYEKWANGDFELQVAAPAPKKSLVTDQAPSNIKLWDEQS